MVFKTLDAGRTAVTIERRVWKEERILWMDKDRDEPATDHRMEKEILDAIATSL